MANINKKIPWYKKRSSIIAMSSTLGVGILAVAVAVPVALFVDFNPTEPISSKVKRFNSKDLPEKIADFNKMITPQFQSSVYKFWMKDSAAVANNTFPVPKTDFYKYVLANLDSTTIELSTPILVLALKDFMTYEAVPPTSSSGDSFTPVTNNMFKILASDSTERSFMSSIKKGTTIVPPTFTVYNLSSLFYSNNSLDINFNLISKDNFEVLINNNNLSLSFFNRITENQLNNRTYNYNKTYKLNDGFTNNLLSPLIKNFLNSNI